MTSDEYTKQQWRFWGKVDRSGSCWLWKGAVHPSGGHGIFNAGKERGTVYAHRFAYESLRGPIPEGAVLMHLCDNPRCVNVNHLSVGTQAENMRDRQEKGRTRRGEAHGGARLTKDIVARIRAYAADGISQVDIARILGVSPRTVSHVVRGQTWKDE